MIATMMLFDDNVDEVHDHHHDFGYDDRGGFVSILSLFIHPFINLSN